MDVRGRRLLVHRRPIEAPEQPFHHAYVEVTAFQAEAYVAPLCRPDQSLRIADLL